MPAFEAAVAAELETAEPLPHNRFKVPLAQRLSTEDEVGAQADLARHAFGAQFVEVHVDVDTAEIRARAVGCSPRATSSTPARHGRSSWAP